MLAFGAPLIATVTRPVLGFETSTCSCVSGFLTVLSIGVSATAASGDVSTATAASGVAAGTGSGAFTSASGVAVATISTCDPLLTTCGPGAFLLPNSTNAPRPTPTPATTGAEMMIPDRVAPLLGAIVACGVGTYPAGVGVCGIGVCMYGVGAGCDGRIAGVISPPRGVICGDCGVY